MGFRGAQSVERRIVVDKVAIAQAICVLVKRVHVLVEKLNASLRVLFAFEDSRKF